MDPTAVWMSPDHRLLASQHQGSTNILDLTTGQMRSLPGVKVGRDYGVAICRQNKTIAHAQQDHSVELHDLNSGQLVARLQGHRQLIGSMNFTPDGQTLASGSWDGTVRLWHIATGRELLTLEGHQGRVEYVAFSNDGRLLVSWATGPDGGGEAFLWDAPHDHRLTRPE